jgi:penicillin-binding protein 2
MDRFKLSLAGREKLSLILLFAILLFLAAGLVKLQVVEHSKYAKKSETNRIRVVPIVPRRGVVYDREGRVIIDNRPSYTVSVVAAEEIPGVTLKNLSDVIGLDTLEIRRRLRKNMVNRYQPAPVKKDIPFEAVAVLEEQASRFPGVSYQMERVREYADSLGPESFTGYVGEVSQEELELNKDVDLRLGSMIGKKGLERQYDHLLRGSEGTAYMEVYASGQIRGPYEGTSWKKATPGSDLTLTVDKDLQRACVEAIDTFCCGAIVAMDPRNGEILAMTSYPGYDANLFSSVIPDTSWQRLRDDPNNPLINRPLSGQYPPGSTLKPLVVGAGLEEGIITPASVFQVPCRGGMQFGNRFFRCWNPAGHGKLDAPHALEQSCDVYFYQLGLKLGVDGISKYLGLCGFGTPTEVDLPNESPGLNPNSEYYDKRYGRNKWTRALAMNNSIGQGEILCTPLQLAQFYCGIANDGVVYQPHIVGEASTTSGETITMTPKVAFRLPFSKETLTVIKEGLRLVVQGEKGTARRLRRKDFEVGGKTGTSQNPHGLDHSLFVGIAPLDAPEIVVCAVVENAGHGSEVAAPVVGQIIDTYMNKHYPKEPVSEVAVTVENQSP